MPIVPVRVTDDQHAWLKGQAEASGHRDVSKYVRAQLGLNDQPVIARLDRILALLEELRR